MTPETLHVPLAAGPARLVPLAEAHREGLRAACAADTEIWPIYSTNLTGEDFDREFDTKLAGGGQRAFAVLDGDGIVGCTSWYGIDPGNRVVAIGYTYLAPHVRGSGFNFAVKAAMVRHAWALGFHRIHFDVDVRNTRSQAAIRKLGAKHEGILRRNKITWTGHIRDTVILSLLPGEESDALRAWM
ncbi:N-acetyltransferase [Polymorphobacter arshaanensis]|uniref:N-acetyltransferase n=1 Tax=Glacieibacterium arshaanense TaxID=2511025 RepID=A0A4Y9ENL4_9SPHN|nr:GNAT family N-acetyltransferase [Polymorphobacter arshaanensis]TFU03627.1 N-acetyltransferase [Polymorphobacter arshaanensis]